MAVHIQPMEEQVMNSSRRKVLKGTGGVAVLGLAMVAGLVRPGSAWAQQAWNKAAFDTKSLADAMKALGGSMPTESKDIQFVNTPDIAENGAVVPFTISSKIPKTESIALLIEKNPSILAASFSIPEGTEAWINTRAKMGQSSNVIALVKADGKYYYASKEVKVTLGGCGG
jgi:sulfur-oxidizing protein SoxY